MIKLNHHFMDRVLFAAVMTALSELEDFRKNENFGVSIDKEVSFVTCADDFDASNGRECLYKMLLNIVRDANAACINDNGEGSDINSETKDLDSSVISGIICGILYQSISETDVDEKQKISLLNCGLKYCGLDAELSGEMFFGTDQKLGDIMLNMLNVGLSMALEGAIKAEYPSAGTQFITTLTELLAHTKAKIEEEFPSVLFKTKPWEIPINFAIDFYNNKMHEMGAEEEMLEPNNKKVPDGSNPILYHENIHTWITDEYLSIENITKEIISRFIEENSDKYFEDSELFVFKAPKHIYNDQLEINRTFFYLSANNRFITTTYVKDSFKLRDEPKEDFIDKLFNVTCDPSSHSISIGSYTIYFDTPFDYNYALILIIDADNHFKEGERISDRIITYPLIRIDDEILSKYDIHINEAERGGLLLRDASYCVLNDYNEESTSKRAEGTFDLRFINMDDYDPQNIVTYSMYDVLTSEFEFVNISIIHVPPYDELNKTPYLPFGFLLSADALTLRGSIETLELFVCRLKDGWGGIKFKLSTEEDFYKLVTWLLLATSAYFKSLRGWNREKCVREYWPTYSEKDVDNIKISSRNNWKLYFEKTLVWDENINTFQQKSLQIWDQPSDPIPYNEVNYACQISLTDPENNGTSRLSQNDEIICEYVNLGNTGIVILDSDTIFVLSEYQITLLDQLNKATDNFKLFKSDCSEEIQIKKLNGTCVSSNNEDGDLEVSLDKLYVWDSSRHTFVECSMMLKYSVNSDAAYPVKINIMYGDESDGKASRVDAAQNIDIHFIEDIGITILNGIIMILSDTQKEFFQQKLNG